eukprot:CAMPEP_0185570776 /NCGR_PEP_ID=MMETSP0434-20130131/2961_1 /TAXON_ID=626734 ORGANISM="Favella taraikaensis, Strain Fe Narragansett Bay" /NCGR_SAMPLE_ID=MMETSP0434 /ASSEMBLY_ACC=CAM_ASM_000379 /LENGTH=178 /DNA_ID=CAMNT_0028185977 /DNA_START=2203 /DNA_END=2739 /DNA_ORIENTATION=+
MEESANVHLVATCAIALNALVFVRVVETLDGSVALAAFEATLAVIPAEAVLERLAILRRILKKVGRAAEVARMMRIEARFAVVAVLLRWAPTRLVEEHKKDVALFLRVNVIQPLVQVRELQQALWHEVIFDALVLEVAIHGLDQLEVLEGEADQLVGCLVLIQGHNQRTIKSVMAEQF